MTSRFTIALAALAVLALASSCGKRRPDFLFHWDGRRVICSRSLDDYQRAVRWDAIDLAIRKAKATGAVVAIHAHIPGTTVTRATVAHLLELADQYDLPTVTFRELGDGPPRAGLALAFDDDTPAAWATLADLFAAHHAHVTFFVTKWEHMSPADRAQVLALAAGGHDIEPHGAVHVHAPAYARDHGVAAYVRDEALPSILSLAAAGLPPATTYAYPWGEHTPELDAALLMFVPRLRVTTSQCPP